MNRIKLKDDIFIEGFDSEFEAISTGGSMWFGKNMELLIYGGETDDIPNEIMEQITTYYDGCYINFMGFLDDAWGCDTPLKSIKSACPNEYCIIYKEICLV